MPQSPLFKSYRIEGNTIRIGFDNPEKAFMKPDTIKGFIIAGADHIFYPATVTIQKKKIIVESPDVPHPVAVRYNWADNPDGNLYGLSGLPTTPFPLQTIGNKTRLSLFFYEKGSFVIMNISIFALYFQKN